MIEWFVAGGLLVGGFWLLRESLARLWDGGGDSLRQEAVHRMQGARPSAAPAAAAERSREPVPA